MRAIPHTHRMDRLPKQQLGLVILGSNCGHVSRDFSAILCPLRPRTDYCREFLRAQVPLPTLIMRPRGSSCKHVFTVFALSASVSPSLLRTATAIAVLCIERDDVRSNSSAASRI